MLKHVRAAGLERLELQRLRDRVGRLFAALQEAMEVDAPLASATWSPPADLCETENEIIVRLELPGVAADQIKVGLTNSQMRVSGEKKRRVPRNRITSHLCSERNYGRFMRIVPLRWTINVRDASAELANGVLLVKLPKTTDRRGKEFKVPIKDKNPEQS
ncbi:MAG TPA: Hsp20/alpha crystallin family protein [Pyrinomonadaceae bacterium]|jgi:HSP20 family protein|nr:Hsp20/alpha crystallin family protein [Pyrinomonadaceae bacterium]